MKREPGPPRVARVPFADLERYMNAVYGGDYDQEIHGLNYQYRDRRLTHAQIGVHCGAPRNRVTAWREREISVTQADRIAHHLGVHPCEIWGMAWFTDLTLEEHEYEALGLPIP